jgi:hypothetical protein
MTGWVTCRPGAFRPFGDPIDGLLLDIIALGGTRRLNAPKLKTALWNTYLAGPDGDPIGKVGRDALASRLTELRQSLERYASDSGWEVPDRH